LNKNNSSSEELNSSIQHLISILESQKQSHDAVISKNRTDEGNISKSTKNDMIELMVKDLVQTLKSNKSRLRTTIFIERRRYTILNQWIISGANGKRYSSQFVWLLCLFLSHARTRLAKSNFLTTNLMISAE
jgi:hypothetical protein